MLKDARGFWVAFAFKNPHAAVRFALAGQLLLLPSGVGARLRQSW